MLYGILGAYFGFMSIVTFIMFCVDKNRAIRHQWRIKERTLIGFSFLGGAIGGIMGMAIVHHKNRKPKFIICVPLALIFNVLVAVAILYLAKNL